jgi:NAD(P)-dependent dehydrogenase (short-subunit alcohol dehydrogenase family)
MASTIEGTKGAAAITGSAQGIGLGIAHRLAEDGYGVVLNDLPSKQETLDKIVATIIGNGGRAVAVTGDVSVEGDVKNIVERSVTAFGQLDVVRIPHA